MIWRFRTLPERTYWLLAVLRPDGPLGTLLLDVPVSLQAGLLPLAVLGRHPGQPSVFALADFFLWGLRSAQLLGAHPEIPGLTDLTLSRALVGDDDRDDDYDRDKDPQLSRHDGTPFAPRASCFARVTRMVPPQPDPGRG